MANLANDALAFWISISTSYFSWIGLVSTIAWIAGFAPRIRDFIIVKSHPAIWKYGLAALSIAMFTGAAFNAFHQKSEEVRTLNGRLNDIENSAEGSFASPSSSVNAGDPWKPYILLHNYSLNRAIQFDVVSASVSVNGIKFSINSKPSPPIPPSSDATFGMGEFPASALSSDGKVNILRFEFHSKYGFVGFEKNSNIVE